MMLLQKKQLKKAALAAIFLCLASSGLHSKVDFSEELSNINDPWETMGTIFYDEYLKLYNDYNWYEELLPVLALGFIGTAGGAVGAVTGAAVGGTAGGVVGSIAGGLKLLIQKSNENKGKKFLQVALPCTAVGALTVASIGFASTASYIIWKVGEDLFDNRLVRNKKVLLELIELWKNKPSAIPEEMHGLCIKLYNEYLKNPEQALTENASLAKELHLKVIQKSAFYHIKDFDRKSKDDRGKENNSFWLCLLDSLGKSSLDSCKRDKKQTQSFYPPIIDQPNNYKYTDQNYDDLEAKFYGKNKDSFRNYRESKSYSKRGQFR